jgi:hypothetical protein
MPPWQPKLAQLRDQFFALLEADVYLYAVRIAGPKRSFDSLPCKGASFGLEDGPLRLYEGVDGDEAWRLGKPVLRPGVPRMHRTGSAPNDWVFWERQAFFGTDPTAFRVYEDLSRQAGECYGAYQGFRYPIRDFVAAWNSLLVDLSDDRGDAEPIKHHRDPWDMSDAFAFGWKPVRFKRSRPVYDSADIARGFNVGRVRLIPNVFAASVVVIDWIVQRHGQSAAGMPPIICSQAALADALGYCENTSRLIETLKKRGIISRAVQMGNYWHIWLSDPEQHATVLRQISGKPHHRRKKASGVEKRRKT